MNRSYLIIEDEIQYKEDYRFHMILSNRIEGILPCSVRGVDDQTRFYYDISAKQSLKEYLQGHTVDEAFFHRFLAALLQIEDICYQYLLSMENLLLRPEYIYLRDDAFYFCYLPIWKENTRDALGELFHRILSYLQRPTANVSHQIYRIQEDLAANKSLQEMAGGILPGEENLDANEIDFTWEKAEEEQVPEKLPNRNPITKKKKFRIFLLLSILVLLVLLCIVTSGEERLPRLFAGMVILFAVIWELIRRSKESRDRFQSRIASFRNEKRKRAEPKEDKELYAILEEDDMEEDPPTTMLVGGAYDAMPYLIDDYAEQIKVTTSPFTIGSKESAVDETILNPAISRKHARLEKRAGVWFIEDLGSTNGTYHNEERLEKGERIELSEGDRIRFANFTYHVQFR